jgi:hypothetical protein
MKPRAYREGRVIVRDSVPTDAIYIGGRLRDTDIAECKALAGLGPVAAVMTSLRMSERAATVLLDNTPVLIFGVSSHPEDHGVGIPWMLATDRIHELWFTFLRHGKALADEMFAGYRALTNVMIVQNSVEHRWLRSLGFDFTDINEAGGLNGEPVIYFVKEQSPCAP